MREVVIHNVDFDLFDQDVSPLEYEFFKKHTGAFKRMLEDQPKVAKKKFILEFGKFSIHHGCMKGFPTKSENFYGYLDEASAYYDDNFVNGKFSTAKRVVEDAVCLAQNRPNLQYMGASSYAKDPFFYKETRDVFRRLFGQPSEKGTCLKVVCVLPLHIKFGGALCRYLRRWLEAEDVPMPVRQKLTSAPEKASTKPKQMQEKNTEKNFQEKKDPKADDKTSSVKTEKSSNLPEKGTKPSSKDEKQKETSGFSFLDRLSPHDPFSVFNPSSFLKFNSDSANVTLSDHLGVSSGVGDSKKDPQKNTADIDTTDTPLEVPNKRFPFEFLLKENFPLKNKQSMGSDLMQDIRDSSRSYVRSTKASTVESDEEDWERLVIKQQGICSEDHHSDDKQLQNSDVFKLEKDGSLTNIREMFPELHLGKPHPNKIFEEMQAAKRNEEAETKEITPERRKELATILNNLQNSTAEGRFGPGITSVNDHSTKESPRKSHACANCRRVEPSPNTFKKCQRCKGKRTRFYCGRKCQGEDWVSRHREEHNTLDAVLS